jgi:hypothetical protein
VTVTPRLSHTALGTAAALLICASSACTAPAPKPVTPKPSSPTTSVSPDRNEQAQQHALAAYTSMWADFVTAAQTADWKYPPLGEHATGAALAQMVHGLHGQRQKGLVTKGPPPSFAPEIVKVASTSADVRDCVDDTHWVNYIAATGKLENNTPGGRRLVLAHVEARGGWWSVTGYSVGAVGSC